MRNTGEASGKYILDPDTGNPRPPVNQPGYYPGFSTISQRKYWDEATRIVIEDRVYNLPPIRFFNDVERITMTAIADRILPQGDRTPEYRIPIVNAIDERLFKNKIDGYRFEGMPPDQDVYRMGLVAIDEIARELHAKPFADLAPLQQDSILKSIHDAKPKAAHETWKRMSVERFWHMIVGDCVDAYYAHPWAWDEIGFGGPAYPRAYTRLENGLPEPWEVDERRYEWAAPADSLSDVYEELPSGQESVSGQGGTH
ncbi:MAG: gluconate 2-dehydrogenase subunit 3 family protein [Acidobacteriota bacterium]|nr:gluconate 2-dehydrogenase subunit 3 family protein [Acidobacteriota bacterium]